MQCFFLYLDNIAVIMILDLLRPNQGVALKVIDATNVTARHWTQESDEPWVVFENVKPGKSCFTERKEFSY